MIRGKLFRSLAISAISGLSVVMTSSMATAQSSPSQSSSSDNSNGAQQGGSSDNFQPVYDLAPAMARYAFAAASYERTYSDLIGTSNRVRKEFYASGDYLTAKHAIEDAQAAYEQAAAPVLAQVHVDQAYQAAMEKRRQADQSLKYAVLSQAMRLEVAREKMEFSAEAGRMEADALAQDGNVQQAKTRVQAMQRALDDKNAQFEASLYTNSSVVAVKHAYDDATTTLAGAQGALYGAWIARNDTVDADIRRSNVAIYANSWSPYSGRLLRHRFRLLWAEYRNHQTLSFELVLPKESPRCTSGALFLIHVAAPDTNAI